VKPSDVYFVRGQGDQFTSSGIDWMARDVVSWNIAGSRVRLFNWGQWEQIRDDINARAALDVTRLAVTYSLGANCFTWVLGGVDFQGRHGAGIKNGCFDHVTFIDPTWASVITPITSTKLKAAKHFRGTFPDFVGHGELVLNPPRIQIDREEVFIEHLFLPVYPPLRSWTLDNLRRRMTS
jgi:hypothetical protein